MTGSLSVFNHRTNVDINQRVVCYDIKDLGKQLKKLGMLIVQDQVWNRVTVNRYQKKTTRYFIDEFHLLLREAQTAEYSIEIWKRFRKWGGIPTGVTQNIKDLLESSQVENIFDNSEYICMLNQAAGDREVLAEHLGISPHQMRFVTRVGEGQGLIVYGSLIMPFVDHFPKDTKMYDIMTTKLSETSQKNQAEGNPDEKKAVTASEEPKETASSEKETLQKTVFRTEKPEMPKKNGKMEHPDSLERTEKLLAAVDRLLSGKRKVWEGSASQLAGKLRGVKVSEHVITRKLGEQAEELRTRYGICFEKDRTREGRIIRLYKTVSENNTDNRGINLEQKADSIINDMDAAPEQKEGNTE